MALSGSAATTPIGSLPTQPPGVAKGSRARLPALPRENQVDMESPLRPLPFPLLSFSDHSIMGGFREERCPARPSPYPLAAGGIDFGVDVLQRQSIGTGFHRGLLHGCRCGLGAGPAQGAQRFFQALIRRRRQQTQ